MPLGPCLLRGNTSVVSSQSVPSGWRARFGTGLAPGTPNESRVMLLSITIAQWPLSPKAAISLRLRKGSLNQRSGLSHLQQPSLPQSTHLQNGLCTSSWRSMCEGGPMERLGRDPVHISGLWGRRTCSAACSASSSSCPSWAAQDPLLHGICVPPHPPTWRLTLPPKVHKSLNLRFSLTSDSFSLPGGVMGRTSASLRH